MKRFIDAGRAAIETKNQYAALSVALTLPDICASLEDPGPGKAHKRYVAWFAKWAASHFGDFLTAEDCFQLRCSLIHSGSTEIEETKRAGIDKFEFLSDAGAPHLISMQGNSFNGEAQPSVVVLNTNKFCESMYQATEAWDASIAEDAKLQEAKASLLVIKPPGTTMQGIRFG